VGNHYDGLPVFFVEGLKQIKDLIARFAIQVASRLVTEKQGGVGHNASSNAHALLLTPGERPWIVPGTM
jgi:hypothetical protein